MNIHIKDKDLVMQLFENAIFSIEVGSGMYGLKTESSDKDVLVIYGENEKNANSIIRTHHQLQYKENNTDYIFTSLTQFINNILSGDSTINYEVLKSDEFKNKCDVFARLSDMEIFSSRNIVKSYLGLAKRDLRTVKGAFDAKKMYHVVRGIEFADAITDGENIFDRLNTIMPKLKSIRNCDDLMYDVIIDLYEKRMVNLRLHTDLLNPANNVNDLLEIDNEIATIYRAKQFEDIDYGSYIFDAVYNNKFNWEK